MLQILPFEYAARNLGRSWSRLAAIVAGSALVALLALAAASFVQGMRRGLVVGVNPNNVILMASGSEESIERSEISFSAAGQAEANISGLRETYGVRYVSPEINVALIARESRETGEDLRAVIRGFTPTAYLTHPRAQIIEGRSPRPGADEIMVGELAARKLGLSDQRLAIGQSLYFGDRDWTIVGRFAAPGTMMAGEIWAPLRDVQVATKRDGISCVFLTLGDAEFADVDVFTKIRTDLELAAVREADYYASLLRFFAPVRAMVWTTAMLIGLAGVFGGLNTMYAAFAARVREVGMLQSLGYSRAAIVLSLTQESLLACAAGSLLAAVVALAAIDGIAVRYSMGVFELNVDSAALLYGMGAGLLMGLIGSLPPAIACLRMPIPQALKA